MTLRSSDPKDDQQRTPMDPVLVQEETVVTHAPTQDTTERRATNGAAAATVSRTMVRDVVGERRRTVSQATQIIWYVVGLFEAMLALRLVLLLSGANPEAGFTQLILSLTRPLVALFLGIFPNVTLESLAFEPATLVAMLVYFLLGLGLSRLAWIVYGEPREVS